MRRFLKHLIVLSVSVLWAQMASGGTLIESTVRVVPGNRAYRAGTLELSIATSALTSIKSDSPERPACVYLQHEVALGVMLCDPRGDSWYRGNLEVLLNLFGAEVLSGPGSLLSGGRLSLRYNFVQDDAKWVPFIEIGAGALGTDAYRDRKQRLIGCAFEFLLTGSLGVRYHISERWALHATFRFEHVSNADRTSRNLGLNAIGGGLGFSRFF